MRKFNLFLPVSILIYMICAIVVGYHMVHLQQTSSYAYRIEVNRIMEELQAGKTIDELNIKAYQTITAVTYLDANDKQTTQMVSFYEDKDTPYVIMPWMKDGQIEGYLRFDYHIQKSQKHIFLIVEGILFIVEVFVFTLLWYLKKHLIKPFQRLSTLPESFAKGHYKSSIKVEKSRYLQRFLWGMSQMQDSLDTSRKRQIELLKEKKQMHLSLSHDIKTPLNLIKLYCKALKEHVYESYDQQAHRPKEEMPISSFSVTLIINILDLQVEKGEFYLYDLMKRVLDTYKEQCVLRQIELYVGPCENRLLYGDIDRSQEIFENLFENAFKYGDGRLIEITFYEEDGCQLIRVFNTGQVLEERELVHLFESFYRGSNAQHQNGNGLGLYIAQTLMRKMEGEIFVQQEKDGMAFIMVFH